MSEKPRVPVWRWVAWVAVLVPALFVFYVLLTPVWIAIRVTRWLAGRRDFTSTKQRTWQALAAPGKQRKEHS